MEATTQAEVPGPGTADGGGNGPRRRLGTVMRDSDRVTPLELFFDLVFVLTLTQCTALMAHEPHLYGIARGLLVLGMLWWAWVGYAWLTSVINPEEGAVRPSIFSHTWPSACATFTA